MSSIIRPVILCGGAGTRLWPVSRELLPKQFLHLAGDQSLLQQTIERLRGGRFAPAMIVSAEAQKPLIDRDLRDASAQIEVVLLEPVGRNTAAAAALAASWLELQGRDELLLLMPSDHVIGDTDAFKRAIEIALPHAESGAIVTFGAEPTDPNTQYGYIEAKFSDRKEDAYEIARFHEKPDAIRAAEYLLSGHFFWNCGIFLAKASTLLDEMRHYLPSSVQAICSAIRDANVEGLFVKASPDTFAQADNISIDYGIMEKTSRGVVVPVQMRWSDIGGWDAVWKLGNKDMDGNVTHGDVVTLNCHNSLIRGDGQAKVAVIGLQNICVVAVDDAVLVAPLDRAAEVKDVVATITAREAKTYPHVTDGTRSKP